MKQTISRRNFLKFAGTAALGTLAAGYASAPGLVERYEISQLPSAPEDAYNVLLLVMDTVRSQNLSLYGYQRVTTPKLDQLAKSGIVFDKAIVPAPWTLPSHASMFTGRWHHELSTNWRTPLDRTFPTLAEVLSEAGYLTAGFVANTFYLSVEHGTNRGFIHYEDYLVRPDEILVSSSLARTVANNNFVRDITNYHDYIIRRSAEDLNTSAIRWLSKQNDRPFFTFINYMEAHEPYLPPKPYDGQFGPRIVRDHSEVTHELRRSLRWDRINMPPEQIQAEIDSYDGAIAYLDDQISALLETLNEMGKLENTLVIITSDHGEQFGEHMLYGHGQSLYWPSLHVPLIFLLPGEHPSGLRIERPVSLRDMAATILDILGVENANKIPGESMAQYWNDPAAAAGMLETPLLSEVYGGFGHYDWYPIAQGDVKSIYLEGYHYIKIGDDQEELYKVDEDPSEENDLAQSAEHNTLLKDMRIELEAVSRT